MQKSLNLMMDIINAKEYKESYDLAYFINDVIKEDEIDNDGRSVFKGLFESLDVDLDEDDYINYIKNNLNEIIAEISYYLNNTLADMYENGEVFEIYIQKDENRYHSIEDDMMDNWVDIESLYDEDIATESNGLWLNGTSQSAKKDRSIVVWKDEDLEG